LKPAVMPIEPAETVFGFERQAGFDRPLPCRPEARQIVGMNDVSTTPILQFLERSPEVLKNLTVDVVDLTGGRRHGDETGDRLDDQPKGLFPDPDSPVILHTRILGPSLSS
jgi:hypothetical protein